jgi:hypothetical protein
MAWHDAAELAAALVAAYRDLAAPDVGPYDGDRLTSAPQAELAAAGERGGKRLVDGVGERRTSDCGERYGAHS